MELSDCFACFIVFHQVGSPLTSSEQAGPTGSTFSVRALTYIKRNEEIILRTEFVSSNYLIFLILNLFVFL